MANQERTTYQTTTRERDILMTFHTFITSYLYFMSLADMYQIHRLESQVEDIKKEIADIKANFNKSDKKDPLLKKDLTDARTR